MIPKRVIGSILSWFDLFHGFRLRFSCSTFYGRKTQDNYNCFIVTLFDNLYRKRESFLVIAETDFQVNV